MVRLQGGDTPAHRSLTVTVSRSKAMQGTSMAAWSDRFAAAVMPADCRSRPGPRDGGLTEAMLGPLGIARLAAGVGTIERNTGHLVQRDAPVYLILLQLGGSSEVSHYGNTITLAAGDMVLCDSAAPLKIAFDTTVDTLFLRVPAALLKEHLPSPECCCGRALRGGEGVTATASTMAVSLSDQLADGLSLHYQERVARHLLDVVATAYALAFHTPDSRSSIVSGRCATVKLFIEQHLRDPDLTPCSIAAQMKLSSRYLRMIFASENETVSAYILRRRLEQCARQIADPAWRGHSMTEIAFGWGFNSAPHFTRTFRDRFDMAPRDYRRLKLDEGAGQFRRPAPRQSMQQDARAA
jgi:AraC family transcriptional activator of tynA and feaB